MPVCLFGTTKQKNVRTTIVASSHISVITTQSGVCEKRSRVTSQFQVDAVLMMMEHVCFDSTETANKAKTICGQYHWVNNKYSNRHLNWQAGKKKKLVPGYTISCVWISAYDRLKTSRCCFSWFFQEIPRWRFVTHLVFLFQIKQLIQLYANLQFANQKVKQIVVIRCIKNK